MAPLSTTSTSRPSPGRVDHSDPCHRSLIEPGQQRCRFSESHGAFDQLLRSQHTSLDELEHLWVVRCGHAVAAQEAQLPTDHPLHRNGRMPRYSWEQPNLDVPPTALQTQHRLSTGLFAADGVDRHMAASLSDVHDGCGDVATVGRQRMLSSQRDGGLKSLRIAVHHEHARTQGPSDHDRAQAHPARPDHGQPLPCAQSGPVDQRTVSGGEAAAQACRRCEVKTIGHRHQVGICSMKRHVPGERAPVSKPRLVLMRTDLGLTCKAPPARTAAAHEGNRHPVSHTPALDARAHRNDHPGQFVARNMGKRDLLVSSPAMPVTAAQPCGPDLHDDPEVRRAGLGHLTDLGPAADGIKDNCAHGCHCGRPPSRLRLRRKNMRYRSPVKIGVFDSGLGGEAVAARLRQLIPYATVITAADPAHVPYGSRADDEVYRLTSSALEPLFAAGCDVIVLACNTATAAAVDQLRRDHPTTPFVGLEPMIKPASFLTHTGSVVVCATPSTLGSRRYRMLKQQWASRLTLTEPDCSTWAAAVEQGRGDSVDLAPLRRHIRQASADVVVLACTHYHWLKARVEDAAGPGVTVLEPTDAVAAQIRRITAAAGDGAVDQPAPSGLPR